MLVQSELVTSEIISMLISTKNRAKGQPYCAYTFYLSRRVTYVHLWMAYYFSKWPNTCRPYVLVPTFSYFELCKCN